MTTKNLSHHRVCMDSNTFTRFHTTLIYHSEADENFAFYTSKKSHSDNIIQLIFNLKII